MTIGIIDDETTNRLLIRNLLENFAPAEQVVVMEGLIDTSVQKLNKIRPDLVFLDVELRNGTGFDILKKLDYRPEVIFTTAYSQYAIDAIKVHAFDYLLKPINEQELISSLNLCREKLKKEKNQDQKPAIHENFFTIATNEGKLSLTFNEICYFESSGSYTYCVTQNKKIIFSKNIGEVEKELPREVFFRTHHSYIVNMSKIRRIEIKRNGRVFLDNNAIVPLAQRKIKSFKSFFQSGTQ